MEALPVRNYVTVEELARRTGSSRETVWRWLSFMMKIQDMPRVQSARVGEGSIVPSEFLAKMQVWLKLFSSEARA
jgi:predicted DNA-binding transcriptional regulator AlpA